MKMYTNPPYTKDPTRNHSSRFTNINELASLKESNMQDIYDGCSFLLFFLFFCCFFSDLSSHKTWPATNIGNHID